MIHRRSLFTCGLFAVFALLVGVLVAQEHAGPHWGYTGNEGPDHWAALDKSFAACQKGRQQSPIDIRTSKAVDLPPIQFAYQPTPLHIVNNGHTIQVNYAPGSFITVGDKRYELKQFHFHHPSEEEINGKHFAMEAHLVHAAPDGTLAVVAVLLDAGADNHLVATLWPRLTSHEGPEQKFDDIQIDVTELLPKDHSYYTYQGSLTTPPCTENVTWLVLKTPVPITLSESDAFGQIYPNDARPVQPLNGRQVLVSR